VLFRSDGETEVYREKITANKPLPGIVERFRSSFILDNGMEMTAKEFDSLMLINHLGKYWKTYKSGSKLYRTGNALLIGGGGGMLGGIVLTGFYFLWVPNGSLWGRSDSPWGSFFEPIRNLGIVVFCAGFAIMTTAVPLIITGQVKRSVFVDTYNEHCAGKYPSEITENVLSWKLAPSMNGLSFTLNF
jgi:hypothetical protein